MGQQKLKEIRLHEGELNVMELLWSNQVLAAKHFYFLMVVPHLFIKIVFP